MLHLEDARGHLLGLKVKSTLKPNHPSVFAITAAHCKIIIRVLISDRERLIHDCCFDVSDPFKLLLTTKLRYFIGAYYMMRVLEVLACFVYSVSSFFHMYIPLC